MFHIGRLSTVDLEEEITPEEVNSVFHQFIFIHLKKKRKLQNKGHLNSPYSSPEEWLYCFDTAVVSVLIFNVFVVFSCFAC